MSQGRIHLTRAEICGVPTLLAREDNFRRFNIVLNDADLAIPGKQRILDVFSGETRPTNATYLIGDDKLRLRNRDWQERNRVYVGPMYIILTALRVHLRTVEKEDKERPEGGGKRRCVTGEKKSGYWNGEIYRNWESEAACDRRNALVTSNMQGRFIFIAIFFIFISVRRFLNPLYIYSYFYILYGESDYNWRFHGITIDFT